MGHAPSILLHSSPRSRLQLAFESAVRGLAEAGLRAHPNFISLQAYDYEEDMVGERGFEPPTPWSRTRCSTRLSHSPTLQRVPTGNTFTRVVFQQAQRL
jgi:hypothetical protein